jgi:hypothetical protein
MRTILATWISKYLLLVRIKSKLGGFHVQPFAGILCEIKVKFILTKTVAWPLTLFSYLGGWFEFQQGKKWA